MNNLISSAVSLSPFFLAQTLSQPTPSSASSDIAVTWWILGAVGAAIMLNHLIDVWQKLTGRFKERESEGPSYQKVDTCVRLHREITEALDTNEEKHEARTNALRHEMKVDNENLHHRINDVLKAVCRVEGKIQQ